MANKYFVENPAFFVKITAYYQPPEIEKDIIFQPIKKISYKKPAHVFVKYITKFEELFIENQSNFKLLKLFYNETIRSRALDLKVEGPFIIYYWRRRRRVKTFLKNTPSRMAKNLLFLCALGFTEKFKHKLDNNFSYVCNLVCQKIASVLNLFCIESFYNHFE